MRKMLSPQTLTNFRRSKSLPGLLLIGTLHLVVLAMFGEQVSSSLKLIIRNGGIITLYIIAILCLGLGSFLAEVIFQRKGNFTEEILLYIRSEATTLGLLGSLIAITYEGGGTIVKLFSEGKASSEAFAFLFHSWNSTIAGLVASHLGYILLKMRGRDEKEEN